MTDEPFVSETKNGLLTATVTIDGKEYRVDKDDIFVAMAEEMPQLREHVVGMFERAGDQLTTMRYPANIDRLPLNDKTVPFVAALLDLMPAETEAQHKAFDRAVATITDLCDEKVLATHRLMRKTSDEL